jgi:iron(III) transport system permease protein
MNSNGIGRIGAVLALALVAAPALCLLLLAAGLGTDGSSLGKAIPHLLETVLPRYALTTLMLALAVLVIVLATGVGAAWLVAAYEFPGRHLLAWLLVLPMAMPAFVMAYAYTDFLSPAGPLQSLLRDLTGWQVGDYWFPDVHAWPAAAVCLGLSLYPYVYLLARAAFAERSESLMEAARSLGLGPRAVWWRVVWPVARPAIAAGAVLAMMETLADFGTVSYFAVDSFTAGIYRAWQGMGDRAGAARLAVVLLVLVMTLVWLERRSRGRMQFHARGSRPASRRSLKGGTAWRATLACAVPSLLGFVIPSLLLVRSGLSSEVEHGARLWHWVMNTALLGCAGAALVVPCALVAAYALRLSSMPLLRLAVGFANTGYAIPGVVLGVSLLALLGALGRGLDSIAATVGLSLNLTSLGLVAVLYAYLVRFFPVGFQGIDAGLRRISPSMDQSARSLGRGPWQVLFEVHWPLMRRSMGVAALLVFIDCVKELPATLVLRPFDFDTLAVVAHHFAADERLGEAALPALLIVLVGAVPVAWLTRIALADRTSAP